MTSHDAHRPTPTGRRGPQDRGPSAHVLAWLARRLQRLLPVRDGATDLVTAAAGLRALDAGSLYDELVEALRQLGFSHAAVAIVGDDGMRRVVASTRPELVGADAAEPSSGLGGVAIDEDRTVTIDDYRRWERRLDDREEWRGIVSAPVRCFGKPVGVVHGGHTAPGVTDADVEAVEAMALHAGVALEKSRVHEREQALVARLKEVDQLRDDLLSNVSHELRTPLQAVQGMGETLQERWHDLGDDQRTLLLERLNANAARLRQRIEALMAYARFEPGRSELRREPVELGAFVDQLLERLGPVLDERVHRRDAVQSHVWVEADRALLEQVVENLVGNALGHTAHDVPITVSVVVDGDVAGVQVVDAGEGMSAEEVARVTERFYRGGHPDRRPTSGLGLGLSLVAAILEAHGTSLRVQSQPGEGATFGFVLSRCASPDGP